MKIKIEGNKKSGQKGFVNDLNLELKKHQKGSFEYGIISELIASMKLKHKSVSGGS